MALDCRCIDLKGKGYLKIKGSTDNFVFAGNMSQIELAPSVTTNTVPDYTTTAGGSACSSTVIDTINVNMTFNCMNKQDLLIALAGVSTDTATTTAITDEPHTVAADCTFIKLENLVDKSVAPVVTDVGAATTYVVGTDYVVTGTGLEIPDGSTITGDILVTYTQLANTEYDLYQNIAREFEFVFDGVVNNTTQDPFAAIFYKVKFTPATAFNLVTEGFGDIQVTGELLRDAGNVNANGQAQFGKFQDVYLG